VPDWIAVKSPLSVIVLAAGQGKRMNSDLPKVLQPLAGRPLLGYVIEVARALQPAAIHVVYGHGGERVREAFKSDALYWALQSEQLGTGHAVMQAMPAVADDHVVLILYGDVPLVSQATLRTLLERAGPRSVGLLTVMLDDPAGYGRVIRDARGQIRRIVEHRDCSKAQLRVRECNTGVLALPAKLLRRWLGKLTNDNTQGEYYLTDVIALAVRERTKVSPVLAPTVAEVLGVNDRIQLADVEARYRQLRAHELMRAGATLADPARIDVRGAVEVGRDVFIDANVLFEGRVALGDRVRIGANCVIRETVVEADTVIHANCVIDRTHIGPQCVVGPFARLRPESKLHRDVHIGNFVEIKKTVIEEGSKANHLTYLGDTSIGRDVNVGAGTVTCNYDGANKWQTRIEDGAFIGSGSMLVAPLRIGAGATIGAGSTITKDAPAGELTVERSKQVTVPGWQRPRKKS
jgi:bifunctional UDP-N-acetylglucosamine pyrophosphorylase/glucosamine-1-phosphate N-acetyltransferase